MVTSPLEVHLLVGLRRHWCLVLPEDVCWCLWVSRLHFIPFCRPLESPFCSVVRAEELLEDEVRAGKLKHRQVEQGMLFLSL